MSYRPTPGRMAEIRKEGFRTVAVVDLLAEVDALTAERDSARIEAKNNDGSYCIMRDAHESVRKTLVAAERERGRLAAQLAKDAPVAAAARALVEARKAGSAETRKLESDLLCLAGMMGEER